MNTAERLAIIMVMGTATVFGAFGALFRSIRRRERDVASGRLRDPIADGRHTAAAVGQHQRTAIGPATAALYGLIGDTLDAGRWVKAPDALLSEFRRHPDRLLDALVEWRVIERYEDEGIVFYEDVR